MDHICPKSREYRAAEDIDYRCYDMNLTHWMRGPRGVHCYHFGKYWINPQRVDNRPNYTRR
jgi:hypothetical protein